MTEISEFPSEVVSELKSYVYRLIDPRNGETFYVGKGKGNRVFSHAVGQVVELPKEEQNGERPKPKLDRIRAILVAGMSVQHVIHRHGMDDATAFEVEAALIDAYPGLTNASSGHGSADRGAAHALQIARRYTAENVQFNHSVIAITINWSAADNNVLDATRFAWRVALASVNRVEFVLAVVRGIVVGVFVAEKWLPATKENFPEFQVRESDSNRFGFVGHEADEEIRVQYMFKRLPTKKKGVATPFQYYRPEVVGSDSP